MNKLAIFSGNANLGLAQNISKYMKVPLIDVVVGRFSDGEIQVKINEIYAAKTPLSSSPRVHRSITI